MSKKSGCQRLLKPDLSARYDYARALAEAGDIDLAAQNFDYILKSKPEVWQITVTQKYVTMLIKAERFNQAKLVIKKIRRQDPSASQFMETEYKIITERLHSST